MKPYSNLQKYLHRLVLSPKLVREATFHLESLLVPNTPPGDDHVFICGLARSGTTSLLTTLYETGVFASQTYKDMPFILAPNLWNNISQFFLEGDHQERAHKDGIKISNASPEAFEEIFWQTFSGSTEIQDQFYKYVNSVLHKYKSQRYLSKNNHNIRRLDEILTYFPNSHILIPVRNPIHHATSLLEKHRQFCQLAEQDTFIKEYMLLTGHTEFGPNYNPIKTEKLNFVVFDSINHWLEQWTLTYFDILKKYANYQNIIIVSYENMCSKTESWLKLNKEININCEPWNYKPNLRHISITEIDDELLIKANKVYKELCDHSI